MDDMLATDVLKSGTGSPVSQDAFIRMLATIDAADLGTLAQPNCKCGRL